MQTLQKNSFTFFSKHQFPSGDEQLSAVSFFRLQAGHTHDASESQSYGFPLVQILIPIYNIISSYPIDKARISPACLYICRANCSKSPVIKIAIRTEG